MELETEKGGPIRNPSEDSIRQLFAGTMRPGEFIRLARTADDYVHIELDTDEGTGSWEGRILAVYRCDPVTGRVPLEDLLSADPRAELQDMLVRFLRGGAWWQGWPWHETDSPLPPAGKSLRQPAGVSR